MQLARYLFLVSLYVFCLSCINSKQNKNVSPDGTIDVVVTTKNEGNVSFSIRLDNEIIVENSSLGIALNKKDFDFTKELELIDVNHKLIDEQYSMLVGKQLQRRNHCTESVYSFKNNSDEFCDIVFRTFNHGVAYRYKLYNKGDARVVDELSSFNFVSIENTWSIPYSSGDERIFEKRPGGKELEKGTLSFPVLVETASNNWALISESDVSDYPLSSGQFSENQVNFVFSNKKIAENKINPNFQSPWRVMILGNSLASIVESNIIDDLAPASELDDVSWIEPGVTSFPWWGDNLANSYPDTLKKYFDLSAEMNWRYVEFDIPLIGSPGKAAEKWKSVDWIKDVVDYGLSKGVLCYGWDDLKNLNTPEKRKYIFSKYNEFGVRGIKVDFVNSYTQKSRKLVEEVIQDAIKYKLMVSFHGAQSPRGFARTYPNTMTFEAVKGSEYYLEINGGKGLPAYHNCTLPFTRNVLGSMDYTPVAFSSEIRETTMAHELALSVIFESGWQGICDVPEAYLNSVAKPFLTQLNATWDESKFLAGYPGEFCCMARRKESKWFVAGINAGEARTVSFDLPNSKNSKLEVYTDEKGESNKLEIVNCNIESDKPFEIVMDKNGGFVFILEE